jgi:glycosyltransferase involved in cell wall biosynthesis
MENQTEAIDTLVDRSVHRHNGAPARVPAQLDSERFRHGRARTIREIEPGRELSVSVVIPTWNEAGNIGPVLGHLSRFDDIVIVDAHSEDGTVDIARELRPDLTVVQREPRGKGDALRAGFEAATGDVIVIMDADGSMDVREIDVFMSMISVGFDLVKGSRRAVGGGSHDLTVIRSMGNRALCGLANVLFGTNWTDLCYGYLAFRRECLPRLALDADGFEIESQILAHAALAGLRIAEIPSIEMPRISGDSHLNARRDGTRILRAMLAARLAPRARRAAVALRPLDSTREVHGAS